DIRVVASDTTESALERRLQIATIALHTYIAQTKSAEEFQKVTEELQASNEELAAAQTQMREINEQLHIINGELNAKNELLTRLNSDLQNLMDSSEIATVFLDGNLCIKAFTPAMTAIFPLREGDRGRPLTDFVSKIPDIDLPGDVENVRRTLAMLERE